MPRFNYSSALGDNSSPNAPLKRYDPATAIGIGVGAASLIGGLANSYMNLKNQADTNKTNYKIWQEQLAAQKENWKREQENYLQNRKWQLEDTANQRLYDSPQAQKSRYLAAGINPYMANSIGQGQSVQAPPSAPSFSSPASPTPMQYSPVDLGLGIAGQNAANAYFMASKNETDMAATKQHINNETLDTLSKINQRNFENGNTQATMNKILQDIRFNNENWQERSRSIKVANDKIVADQLYLEEQTKAQKLVNDFAPELHDLEKKRLQAEIAQGVAAAAELRARKNLSDNQASLVCKQITEQVIKNANLPKSLHNSNAIQVATYNHIKSQSRLIDQQSKTEKWNTIDIMKESRFKKGDRPLSDYVKYGIDALESEIKGENHFRVPLK